MNQDFLIPVEGYVLNEIESQSELVLGKSIQIHSEHEGFPTLKGVKVAIFGVKETRASVDSYGEADFSDIRIRLYKLFPGDWEVSIADLGDVEQGGMVEDTYFAVSDIVSSLIKKGVIPVIIGGGQDLTYANYRAYDDLEQVVNLVSVDSTFDIGDVDGDLTSRSFLSKIISDLPNNLFNYSNLGYQTYYNSFEEIKLMEDLSFDAFRIGNLAEINIVEPILRDADMVSVDIGGVRRSDAPASNRVSPNGFFGNQICAIARYAGISDKVSSFGIYEYSKELDVRFTTADLIAQMIWYFIEGVNNRIGDYPYCSKEKYEKYTVLFEEDEPINFYKSDKSGRWWLEINLMSHNKYKRHALIPCAYSDYQLALEQEVPEKWYKALNKLT